MISNARQAVRLAARQDRSSSRLSSSNSRGEEKNRARAKGEEGLGDGGAAPAVNIFGRRRSGGPDGARGPRSPRWDAKDGFGAAWWRCFMFISGLVRLGIWVRAGGRGHGHGKSDELTGVHFLLVYSCILKKKTDRLRNEKRVHD